MTIELTAPIGDGRQTLARHYPADPTAGALLVLAHGAGAGQQHPWMTAMAEGLAARGVDVVTFDFPYAHERRRLPDRAPMLEHCFHAAIDAARRHPPLGGRRLFLGGKSMGGRIATHLTASGVDGLRGTVVFGYPLHPPGKPDQLRTAHLPSITTPLFIAQGTRDTFGATDEITAAFRVVPARVTIHVVEGGDHSFAVRGTPFAQVRETVLDAVAAWMARQQ